MCSGTSVPSAAPFLVSPVELSGASSCSEGNAMIENYKVEPLPPEAFNPSALRGLTSAAALADADFDIDMPEGACLTDFGIAVMRRIAETLDFHSEGRPATARVMLNYYADLIEGLHPAHD
jgi:hypothetical protein